MIASEVPGVPGELVQGFSPGYCGQCEVHHVGTLLRCPGCGCDVWWVAHTVKDAAGPGAERFSQAHREPYGDGCQARLRELLEAHMSAQGEDYAYREAGQP